MTTDETTDTAAPRLLCLAMRAFPRRWRAANGQEFLATAAELRAQGLAPHPLRVLVGTVAAGVGVRRRTRPPLRHRIAYRGWNRPVPEPWHDWMRDDLASRWSGAWFLLAALSPLLGVMIWQSLTVDGLGFPEVLLAFYAVLFVVLSPYKIRQIRRRIYPKVGWRSDGTLPPPPAPGDEIGAGPQL